MSVFRRRCSHLECPLWVNSRHHSDGGIGLFSGAFPETRLFRSRRGLKTAIPGSSAQKRKGSEHSGDQQCVSF